MVSVLADVSWQRTRTLMLSGNNAKQWGRAITKLSSLKNLLFVTRKRQTHLGDVARERTFPSSAPFSLVPFPLSAPRLFMLQPIFPISLRAPLCLASRLAHTKIREIKSAVFPETGFRKCVWWSFNAVSKTVLRLVESKGHL